MIGFVFLSVSLDFAHADLEVIESNAKNIDLGSVYSDNDPLNVPKDSEIKLLHTPSNKTFVIKGPFRGQFKDYKGPDLSLWEKMFGTKKDAEPPVGGTRGIRTK